MPIHPVHPIIVDVLVVFSSGPSGYDSQLQVVVCVISDVEAVLYL